MKFGNLYRLMAKGQIGKSLYLEFYNIKLLKSLISLK